MVQKSEGRRSKGVVKVLFVHVLPPLKSIEKKMKNKRTFIPINDYEREILTKEVVAKALERRISKMFIDSIKQKQIIRKYESLMS